VELIQISIDKIKKLSIISRTNIMNKLDELYTNIKAAQYDGKPFVLPVLEHHSIYYTRALILEKFGVSMPLEQVKQMMYEEGLLPDEYYFSDWYIKKYKHGQDIQRQQRV